MKQLEKDASLSLAKKEADIFFRIYGEK